MVSMTSVTSHITRLADKEKERVSASLGHGAPHWGKQDE